MYICLYTHVYIQCRQVCVSKVWCVVFISCDLLCVLAIWHNEILHLIIMCMCITKYGSTLYIGMDEVFQHHAHTFEKSDLNFHFQCEFSFVAAEW